MIIISKKKMLAKERIIKKDHREKEKLFKELKSKEKFSTYSNELNRIFGERCYDKFYNNLFHHRRIQLNSFKKMFEKPIQKGGIKIIQEPFDIKEFNSNLKKMKIKAEEYEYKLKHPHPLKYSPYQKSKDLAEQKAKIYSRKFHLPEIPDIGRYNPNYQSINTHSFSPIIASLDYENFKKYKGDIYAHDPNNNISKIRNELKMKSNINNFRRNQSLKNERFRTEFNRINNKSNKNSEFNDSKSNTSQYLSTSSFGDEKNNHCLKFDSYSPRKPLINKKMYTTELIYNNKKNSLSSRNIKGVIDFNRISNSNYGSYFDEIARNSDNPPLGMYQPNYDFISKKTRNIFLDKKEQKSPKFAQLKKILCGFDTSLEYKLTPSLNNFNTIDYEIDKNK